MGESDARHGPCGDEIEEIRAARGIRVAPRSAAIPQLEIEKDPEFWAKVAEMRFGTIWNQPKVGDRCRVKDKEGVVSHLVVRGDAVDAVDVTFDDGTSGRYAPYRLEKLGAE